MRPDILSVPAGVAKVIAWIALVGALLILCFAAIVAAPEWNWDRTRPSEMWVVLLSGANLVLAVAVLWRRLQRRLDVLRLLSGAFPICWAASLLVAGALTHEAAWQWAVRLGGSVALALIGVGLVIGLRWFVRLAQAIAWWQVLFHFGVTIAVVAGVAVGRSGEQALLTASLQLSLFVLLLRLISQVEAMTQHAATGVRSSRTHKLLRALSFWGALAGLSLGWALDWADAPMVLVVGGAGGAVLGLAWIAAKRQAPCAPQPSRCIELRKIPASTTLGRLFICVTPVVGVGAFLLPLAVCAMEGSGRGAMGVLPLLVGVGTPLLVIALASGLVREFIRSRTHRIVADEAGFRITSGRDSRYLPFVDCEWGELRRTFWGAELVLRSTGFLQVALYPLADLPSVLCAARALRRCLSVRQRVRTEAPIAAQLVSRPKGAALGPWIRSIQDLVRGPAHPYQGRAPTPDMLLQILDDVRSCVADRAGAVVALLALHQEAAVRERLVAGTSPPLVIAAAGLAGADVPSRALEEAIRYLDEDDRTEARAMRRHAGR